MKALELTGKIFGKLTFYLKLKHLKNKRDGCVNANVAIKKL